MHGACNTTQSQHEILGRPTNRPHWPQWPLQNCSLVPFSSNRSIQIQPAWCLAFGYVCKNCIVILYVEISMYMMSLSRIANANAYGSLSPKTTHFAPFYSILTPIEFECAHCTTLPLPLLLLRCCVIFGIFVMLFCHLILKLTNPSGPAGL